MKVEFEIDFEKILESKENIEEVVSELNHSIDPYFALEKLIEKMNEDEYSEIVYVEMKDNHVISDYEADELDRELSDLEEILSPVLEYKAKLQKKILESSSDEQS